MADDKKLVEEITSRDVDFAQWYTDVVKKAELMAYSSVKGFMIFKPAGFAIWEKIKSELDRRFKETGVENVALLLMVTLVAFTLAYLVLSIKQKQVKLN